MLERQTKKKETRKKRETDGRKPKQLIKYQGKIVTITEEHTDKITNLQQRSQTSCVQIESDGTQYWLRVCCRIKTKEVDKKSDNKRMSNESVYNYLWCYVPLPLI